jgi:hypothetical protein
VRVANRTGRLGPDARPGLRRVIACIAAYAIALQVALSGFAAISCLTSDNVALPTEICSEHAASQDDSSGPPSHHHGLYPCALACLTSACAGTTGAVPVPVVVKWPARIASEVTPWSKSIATFLRPAARAPHSPRAPPAA